MSPPSRSLFAAPALGALLLAGCVTVARQPEGKIEPVEPDARYDALFPYYLELCAVTQIRFEGVEVHQSFLPPEDDEDQEEAMLFLAAAETLGTDFALTFGRTVYCARLPLERRQLSDVIEYLNDLNSDYIEAQLADVNEKLERLHALASP